MEILIKTIPHELQEYDTVDNWKIKDDKITIYVSEQEDIYHEALIGFHAFVEALICLKRGIREEDVSAFDIEYEKNRKEGDESEPGDDKNAPYKKEHRFAENIERQIAHELGIDWDEYNGNLSTGVIKSIDSGTSIGDNL